MVENVHNDIAARIVRDFPGRALVMISGIDGSGKSVFAGKIRDALACKGRHGMIVSIDSFHNPRAYRYRQGEYSPQGYYRDSFNLKAFESGVLEPFARGAGRILAQEFDLAGDRVSRRYADLRNNTVVLAEGVFLLRREWRQYPGLSVFLDVRFRTILDRVMVRDCSRVGEETAVRQRYLEKYIPGQVLYLREHKPRLLADLVVDNNDFDQPLIRD